jgi:hypothetical protein
MVKNDKVNSEHKERINKLTRMNSILVILKLMELKKDFYWRTV